MFIISQLWLTSHLRSTVVLLDTGMPGTSREIYNEDANDGTRTCNPLVLRQPPLRNDKHIMINKTHVELVILENKSFYLKHDFFSQL